MMMCSGDDSMFEPKKSANVDQFLKCVVSIWALPVRGVGVKACQDGLGHFFPALPGGVKTCQDGLWHFFPRLPV